MVNIQRHGFKWFFIWFIIDGVDFDVDVDIDVYAFLDVDIDVDVLLDGSDYTEQKMKILRNLISKSVQLMYH